MVVVCGERICVFGLACEYLGIVDIVRWGLSRLMCSGKDSGEDHKSCSAMYQASNSLTIHGGSLLPMPIPSHL
jgi:hypothetical protein